MKKYSVLFILIFGVVALASAQTITNGGFENWTDQGMYFDADGWENPNVDISSMGQLVVEPDDTSAHTGTYNAFLETKDFGFFSLNGVLTNGDYVTIPFQGSYIQGGVPFQDKPASLKFNYKCNPKPGDNCYVGVTLFKDGAEVASAVFADSGAVNSWVEVDLALEYQSQDTPDTMLIIICSSNYEVVGGFMDGGHPGSNLKIDNMRFEGQIGIDDVEVTQFQLYPNPATSKLFVDFPEKNISKVEILDASGQIVSVQQFSDYNNVVVDVEELSSGYYFMKLSDGQSVWIKQFVKP